MVILFVLFCLCVVVICGGFPCVGSLALCVPPMANLLSKLFLAYVFILGLNL